jgi:hypothetical protein
MACNYVNPLAPNNQPSELWVELNNNYDQGTASAIYGTVRSIQELESHRYDAVNDVRANGELTYPAVMRLVSPLLTGRLQDSLNAGNVTALDDIKAKLGTLYEGMRTVMANRKLNRETRNMLPINSGSPNARLPEDTADLRLRADRLEKTNTLISFCEIIDFVRGRISTMAQLSDLAGGLSPDSDDHYSVVSSLREELKLYTDPLNMGSLVQQNSGLERELALLNGDVSRTLTQLDEWLEEAMITRLNQSTTNPELKDNRDALKQALRQGEDANTASRLFQTTGDSANPLVAMSGRKMQIAEWDWKRNTEIFKKTLADKVRALQTAAGNQVKGLYDFMLQFENGKPTGQYVVKESTAYRTERDRIESSLADPNDPTGKLRLAFNTVDFKFLSPAEKQHNIDLANKRRARQEFWQAEDIQRDAANNPYVVDGDNHRYTEEFKRERAQMQKLVDGPKGPQWEPLQALGQDPSFDISYSAFLTKYYEAERETTLPQRAINPATGKNEYTGEVLIGPARFVKRQYVTVQPKWESSGYQRIMSDTSPIGLARKGFYELFTQAQEQQSLRKLPPSVRLNFYGQVPRIRKNRADNAAEAMRNGAKNLLNVLRPNIDLNVYSRSRAVDEQGRYLDGIPIYLVGNLQSQQNIDTAQQEYELAKDARRQDPLNKDLVTKLEAAREKLRAAKSAMPAEDLETDLGRSLLTFFEMAEEYHQLKKAEPVFQQVLSLVEEMKYLNTDNMGKPVPDANGNKTYGPKGQDSNTWKQFRDFMEMNVYNSVQANSLAERVGDGLLRWSGSLMQAFNIGSQVNELVSGNINQVLETRFANKWGATGFLRSGAYLEAQSIVIGGTMRKGGEEIMRLFNDPSLLDKPHDKVTAIMDTLFIHQNISAASALKTGNALADIGYKGLNVFEFYTQATMAVARLKSVDVDVQDDQGNPTGEKKTLWDALEYNEHTGEIVIPEYVGDDAVRSQVIQIRSMIAAIHGNYSERNKVAVQRFLLGRLAYQFKKWTYQLGRSRWGEKYYDEGIQDYREGRYRTMVRFAQNIFTMEMKVRDLWAQLPVSEKINIAKTANDLAVFMALVGAHAMLGAAAGDDDDDDALTHRMVNFMSKQAERSSMEVSAGANPFEWGQLLKNPMPILRSLENARAVFSDFTGVGAYYFTGDEKQIIVQRGLRRGEYKLSNSLLKLLPGGLLKGQWEQSKQTPKYFIPR